MHGAQTGAVAQSDIGFGTLGKREVTARFDGGTITSDGGGLLLRKLEEKLGIVSDFAACFVDYRDPRFIEFTTEELIAQRVWGLVLGYEDLNDHDELRKDPLLATVVGRRDPSGADRWREADRGVALAGKSTLNRLELGFASAAPPGAPCRPHPEGDRYKKIGCNGAAVEDFFVQLFLRCHESPPPRIVIDLDATNDPLHGTQEGKFFHGYYDQYCYLPLYAFCGDFLLCARLRTADRDAADGSLQVAKQLTAKIHAHWPETEILFRGDSGFCRDDFMDWCETHPSGKVHYVFGLAKNSRLLEALAPQMALAESCFPLYQEQVRQLRERWKKEGRTKKSLAEAIANLDNPGRRYGEFQYSTLHSWTRERRVIGKAEYLAGGANPRFVVTSLPQKEGDPRWLYEELYCARGDMENRIKENQLCLFADRTSTHGLWPNQIRLWLSSVAYMTVALLRRYGLPGTDQERAQCDTIRMKLLKVGAQVKVTTRRVWVRLASSYPRQNLFLTVLHNLSRIPEPLRC